jgi:hypothetical protein
MDEADRFDSAQACSNELLDERHLALRSDRNGLVLQPIARTYLDKLDRSRSRRRLHLVAPIRLGAGIFPLAAGVLKICFTMEEVSRCDANLPPALRKGLPSWPAMTAI